MSGPMDKDKLASRTDRALTKGPQPEKPCSKCGEEPRIPGLSWGKACVTKSRHEREERRKASNG